MIDYTNTAALDIEVRRVVYDHTMREGHIPLVVEVASTLGAALPDVQSSFARLSDAHVLVLQESGEVLMANPFSAIPTLFVVEAAGRQYWGNCIWDSLGILAMLGQDGRVVTSCADCSESLMVEVRGGQLITGNVGVIHYAVPAARWWDNIRYT